MTELYLYYSHAQGQTIEKKYINVKKIGIVHPHLRTIFNRAVEYNYWSFRNSAIYLYTKRIRTINGQRKFDFTWNKYWLIPNPHTDPEVVKDSPRIK